MPHSMHHQMQEDDQLSELKKPGNVNQVDPRTTVPASAPLIQPTQLSTASCTELMNEFIESVGAPAEVMKYLVDQVVRTFSF